MLSMRESIQFIIPFQLLVGKIVFKITENDIWKLDLKYSHIHIQNLFTATGDLSAVPFDGWAHKFLSLWAAVAWRLSTKCAEAVIGCNFKSRKCAVSRLAYKPPAPEGRSTPALGRPEEPSIWGQVCRLNAFKRSVLPDREPNVTELRVWLWCWSRPALSLSRSRPTRLLWPVSGSVSGLASRLGMLTG